MPGNTMTYGERVLAAQDPERTVATMSDRELAALLDELVDRTWWNEFWERIYALTLAEVGTRFMAEHLKTGLTGFLDQD